MSAVEPAVAGHHVAPRATAGSERSEHPAPGRGSLLLADPKRHAGRVRRRIARRVGYGRCWARTSDLRLVEAEPSGQAPASAGIKRPDLEGKLGHVPARPCPPHPRRAHRGLRPGCDGALVGPVRSPGPNPGIRINRMPARNGWQSGPIANQSRRGGQTKGRSSARTGRCRDRLAPVGRSSNGRANRVRARVRR